ncbi:ARM repeat-containing protein [Hanseniaspora valbyensis NRRL Y-1626]|uniref:ARM repeat-containing protein n=1 Tax=Hanseniaspora valbyensis NRRL Y-1626 TaxID=766949 RepID=A0A1B7TEZ4_9ASCO|nr:ARM repeat-containing protein [Hanseniaspora valbyensis NRRL Y-1626]
MSDEQFNLTEQLKIFHNNSLEDLQIGFNEENIHSELYEVTDTITLHSSISLGNPNENDWEKFTSIAYYFILLQQKQKLALMNGLKTSIINSCKEINFFYNQMNKDVERDENDLLERKEQEENLKTGLKILGYMVMVCLSTSFQQASNKKGDKQLLDETVSSFQTFLPCLLDLFEINLSRLFPTSTEKSEFIQLFSKSCFSFLEIESIFKISFLKDLLHKIFCLLVKLQNEKANVLNMVTSNVAYYTFSINFYAEFLKQLYDEYDYPQFAEDVLRELSEKEFNPKDITGPKNVALFLVKVSELVPQIMMKQIQLVTKLLNNSSFTLRNAVVEACGNIVYTYYKKKAITNDSTLIESEEEQCSLLIDLLENRLLDTNPYVRSKAVQGLIKLANLKTPSSSSSSASSFNENNLGEDNPNFYPFAECAIECLFKLSDLPDLYCKNIIEHKLKESFASTDLVDEDFSRIASISQLLFIVGEVVLKLIVYLEHSEVQFKRIKNQKETDAKLNKDKEKENELEMISKTTEDDFNDSIGYIRETELLFSPQSLLSQFIPFVVNLLTEYEYTYRNFFIQRIATLTLLKFMLTSKKVCETHLSLLITIMEKSEDPITRSNCILGFGDISVTFNTIIDDNIEFLYNRLMDDDLSVKRTCLMTITFLILAGQVKIKGQLGKMALCLVDTDLKIVQLSKIFFNELSSKDNAVYNGFLDIFNYLSNVVDLTESDFQKIVKFLMNYIQQEKYQKNINNKLISKLKTVEDEKQYDDILYVLQNLINNKDENLDQIIEQGFKKVP